MGHVSKALHDEYSAKLEALLDERDDVADKRRRISKALRGEVHGLDDHIAHVRRVLKGVDSPQMEIPGTEVGERKRDSILRRILDAAARIRDAELDELEKKAKPRMDEAKEDLAQDTGGVDFSAWKKGVLTVPGGEYRVIEENGGDTWTLEWWSEGKREVIAEGFPRPVDAKSAAVMDWKEGRAKKNGVELRPRSKPKKSGLAWMKREDGSWFATVEGGAYHLTIALDGNWTASFAPTTGRAEIVVGGFGLPEAQAKATCETHHGEKSAPKNGATNGVQAESAPAAVPPLEWKWVREDVQEAAGLGGTYELERAKGPGGGFMAKWRKSRAKKSTVIVIGDPEDKAKEACKAHHLSRCADEMLKDSGATEKRKRSGGAGQA